MEFVCGLWVGDKKNKKCEKFLNEKNINITINLTNDLSYLNNKKEFNDIIMQNIKKYEDIRLSDYLLKITNYIFMNLQNNKNILIYCNKNENYNELILLAYLLRYANVNFIKSVEIIRTKLPNSFNNNFNYKSTLQKFMKKI